MTRLILTPDEAHERAEDGTVLLVDIREPAEWAMSGIPQPARAISIHEPGFLDRLTAAGGTPDAPIALICASGGRSAHIQAELTRLGYNEVYDVAEGVKGGPAGPGWVRRELPVRFQD